MSFIHELEESIGKKAIIEMKGMQAGDVTDTWADIDDSIMQFDYTTDTSIRNGLRKFTEWYKNYYAIEKVTTDILQWAYVVMFIL